MKGGLTMKKLMSAANFVTGLFVFGMTGTATAVPVQWSAADGGNGHWYDIVTVGSTISWEEARDEAASAEGCHLVTITSAEENDFVCDLLEAVSDINYAHYWLGGYQADGSAEPSGGWNWVTGEAWDYSNWNTGEPNNLGGEDYLNYMHTSTYWNDIYNAWYMDGYIAECSGNLCDATGMIITRNWESYRDQAQFEMKGMTGVSAGFCDNSGEFTIEFGAEDEPPIYTYTGLNIPPDMDCHCNGSEECVVNIRNIDLDNTVLETLLTGSMTVSLEIDGITCINTGTWTQYNSGGGSLTKYRKDN